MRVAQLNEQSIVINVLIVPSVTFFPNCVIAEGDGDIGDYWDGTKFIAPWEPGHPYYVPPEQGQ
jgi:hypothetical protein